MCLERAGLLAVGIEGRWRAVAVGGVQVGGWTGGMLA